MKEFLVETDGQCFLCLNFLNKIEQENVSLSINSIQYLSRYLNINRSKVFDEYDDGRPISIPQQPS